MLSVLHVECYAGGLLGLMYKTIRVNPQPNILYIQKLQRTAKKNSCCRQEDY